MGKTKARYNQKGRQVVQTQIDEREQKKIKVEQGLQKGNYDESNALVLPSAKRKTKKMKGSNAPPVKILSKKMRKKLEKILDKKEKKLRREQVLSDLVKYQPKSKDLEGLIKLQDVQTLGRKKQKKLDAMGSRGLSYKKNEHGPISSIKGSNKRKYSGADPCPRELQKKLPKSLEHLPVVGISSEESGSDSDDEGTDTEQPLTTEKTESDRKTTEEYIQMHKPPSPQPLRPDVKPEDYEQVEFKILDRLPEVEEMRSKLPVVSMEYEIMSAIQSNIFVIISGATGSGKTTQVPQFLYEAGYASKGMKIGVTEPRRVAAISMAERVAYEMNLSSREVSYQVRFEGNATEDTKIKFMTDGTFMKEIETDPFLKSYSAIIIDEAHERSVNSDIIIGYLSRLALRTKKLKVIIMSATINTDIFTKNFKLFPSPPPVVEVESRMFDVTVHYNKTTPDDYVEEAYKKTCQIHRQLPAGGILIFLTGKNEVVDLSSKLRQTFPMPIDEASNDDETVQPKVKELQRNKTVSDKTSLDVADAFDDVDGELSGDELFEEFHHPKLVCSREKEPPLFVLPMYALLEADKQKLIFQPPPEGARLCVVATNIAEVSLTIPGIVYVVDSGKIKQNDYDPLTGVSHLRVNWTSKASAEQRKGRAGRTQKGHCYRLYSPAVYNFDLPDYTDPDILRRPIDDLVLSMKLIKVPLMSFPFPTPVPEDQMEKSIRHLLNLKALVKKKKPLNKCPYEITPLGEKMSELPVSARFAKMMILSCNHAKLLPYVILLVCVLSTKEVLVDPSTVVSNAGSKEGNPFTGSKKLLGDLLVLLYATCNEDEAVQKGVRPKAMTEISQLRRQLVKRIKLIYPEVTDAVQTRLPLPSANQALQLRRVVLAGSADNIATKIRPNEMTKENKRMLRDAYRLMRTDEPAYLCKGCPLEKDMPTMITFQESYRNDRTGKLYLRGASAISPMWVMEFAPYLCEFSPPLASPPPYYCREKDCVMCRVDVDMAPLKYSLPSVSRPYPVGPELYNHAAYFLLEGDICPILKPFQQFLHKTKLLIDPLAVRLRNERTELVNALKAAVPPNFQSLKSLWKKDEKYLLKEYLAWIHPSHENQKDKVRQIWPPYEKTEWEKNLICEAVV